MFIPGTIFTGDTDLWKGISILKKRGVSFEREEEVWRDILLVRLVILSAVRL